MNASIWIGWDPREAAAFAVARSSIRRHLTQPIPVRGLILDDLVSSGLYTRPTSMKINGEGRAEMVDLLSARADYDGRIATQHANARFLVPHLAGSGWALFMDGDMLVRGNLARMFSSLDPSKAVYCVKHRHDPTSGMKMDGQVQTRYAQKNWSSFIVWNVNHKANAALTLDLINTAPGRDLHALCWIKNDDLIGELPVAYNWLAGHSDPAIDPVVVHHTDGVPDMPGYENAPFSQEWREELRRWAA